MEDAPSFNSESTTRLIVNADDFGQTSGINRAVLELHRAGLLTSATLMARAGATEEAIELALKMPSLNVGCHVVLTDGEPMLPPKRIPSLIDPSTNLFYSSLSAFLGRLLSGRVNPGEIEAETTAQIQSLQTRGLTVSHIDSHKHTHMFPAVLRPLLRGARACGIHSVRNPFEPTWAIRATARRNFFRAAQVSILRSMRPAWARIVSEESFLTTGGSLGVASTGTLEGVTLHRLLDRVRAGTWELVTHPGYNDSDLARAATQLRASRDIERKALPALRDFPAVRLSTWSELKLQQ